MARSKTSSCCARVKLAPKPLASLNFDLGAPGQSTLNSGLAMSVTFSWYLSRMRRASATSFSSRLTMFFFHMPRSSIQPMPNSREATSQAWPKSWEISSLMTEMRNGEPPSRRGANRDAAFAAGKLDGHDLLLALHWSRYQRRKQIYHHRNMRG